MPAITRWFRVTHDINADPEIWELRETFGDRAILVWLECLSIGDRNKGIIGPNSDHTRNQLASKCRTTRSKISAVIEWCLDRGWVGVGLQPDTNPTPTRLQPDSNPVATRLQPDRCLYIVNWAKYNKTREVNQPLSPPTPRLDETIQLKKKNKKAQAPLFVLPDWINRESWDDFVEHRQKIRKPLSPKAMKLSINTLEVLSKGGNDPIAVIEQTIMNGWAGLFPIKPTLVRTGGEPVNQAATDRIKAALVRGL